MSRAIEFRFWDNLLNKMIYREIQSFDYYNKDLVIMQFTGIFDKNGKKIFEGDLISFGDDPMQVVKWDEDFCCWICWDEHTKSNNEGEIFDWYQMRKSHSKHYVIHGSIYENADLAKYAQ